MSEQTQASRPFHSLLPTEIEGFSSLAELALDLRWSWNHGADDIWKRLDSALWELTSNPWVVLQTVSREKLKLLLTDPTFRQEVEALLQVGKRAASSPAWFQQNHPQAPLTCVAYFSLEFMLSEALPIYSGGLGNVAGDQLKAASDLGVPVVGVGLLYQQGYFRQVIDKDGAQQALYPYNDPGQLPITPLRHPNGEWLRLEIALPGYSVWLRAWQVQVGRVKLYLLDSNDAANFPAHRGITSELYGGGPELRLKQELLLGIGGWRLLEALGIQPEICHLNEGHAALAILDRARTFMEATGVPFDAALTATRAGNCFYHAHRGTGRVRSFRSLWSSILRTMPAMCAHLLSGTSRTGARERERRLGTLQHGVSGRTRLRRDQRRQPTAWRGQPADFFTLFARRPVAEIPIGHVTNGVHTPSWDSPAADELWTSCCGKDRWLVSSTVCERPHSRCCRLRDLAMPNSRPQIARRVRPRAVVIAARRIGGHRRGNRGREASVQLGHRHVGLCAPLRDLQASESAAARSRTIGAPPDEPQRPVQLILAGKAHPADIPGQALIRDWVRFVRRYDVRPHAIFLSDYDMLLTERLVEGVDVWINTPQRPWEACGTSGMKVLVNGGLNLLELDGWWAEAYAPSVGWALGDGREHGEDPARDDIEASQLYALLEGQVIPEFYARDENNIPQAWVARVRESMANLTPIYSANRSVREYTEKHYLPGAVSYHQRAANNGALGRQMVDWRHTSEEKWDALSFGGVKVETAGADYVFEAQVCLNHFDPNAMRVELYADAINGGEPVRQQMTRVAQLAGEAGTYAYRVQVAATRPVTDYTARAILYCDGVAVPLEAARIQWQR